MPIIIQWNLKPTGKWNVLKGRSPQTATMFCRDASAADSLDFAAARW